MTRVGRWLLMGVLVAAARVASANPPAMPEPVEAAGVSGPQAALLAVVLVAALVLGGIVLARKRARRTPEA